MQTKNVTNKKTGRLPSILLSALLLLAMAVIGGIVAGTQHPVRASAESTVLPTNCGTPIAIASLYQSNLILYEDGSVFSFGRNNYGQLGDGTTVDKSSPVDITDKFNLADDRIVAVAGGNYHSIALSSEGKVFTFGYNNRNQLGDGTTTTRTSPVDITDKFNLSGDKIVSVSAGSYHNIALSSEGKVFTFGYNYYGQLGNGTSADKSTPVDITDKFNLAGDKIVSVSGGNSHCIALSSGGKVFTFGYNSYGQLGDGTSGTSANKSTPVDITDKFNLSGDKIVSVSGGYNRSFAISESGKVFAFGENNYGQLGDGTTTNRTSPVDITTKFNLSGDKIVSVSGGERNSIALSGDGKVFTFGYNYFGQLGDGTTTNKTSPVDITTKFNLSGDTIVSAAGGEYHTIALSSEGKVFTFGYNNYGQLGNGTTSYKTSPVDITDKISLSDEKIVSVASGYGHTITLSGEGKVLTFGYNNYSQLGDGTSENKSTPVDITDKFNLSGDRIVAVSGGYYHSIALSGDGNVFTFGYNYYGQLGDGTNTNRTSPVDITTNFNLSGDKIVSVSAGSSHTIALSSEGNVFTFGDNYYGQLGDATSANKSTPVDITDKFNLSGEKIVSVSGGYYHNIALSSGGKVFTFGHNSYGQLGDGTSGTGANKSTPVDITDKFNLSGDKIVSVSAGYNRSFAISESGKVFAFGENNYGQLGDGTTTNRTSPVDITTKFNLSGDKIVSVVTGNNHSIALSSEGKVFAFGYNVYGQLGNGNTSNQYAPVEITDNFTLEPNDKIVSVDAGGYNSIALSGRGGVFTFGDNFYGQLGIAPGLSLPSQILLRQHTLTKVEAAAANCTTAGNIEYWECSDCDKFFSDAAGTTEIGDKSSVVIPVTHDLTKVEAKEANCTTAGNIAYWECSDCDKYFSDAAGTAEIADKSSVVIPKTSHALTKVDAVPATCIATGNIAYWECSDCGEYFSDAAGTAEIADKSSVVIPKTSHALTKVEAKEANCTTAGNIEYWECSECDKYFSDAAGTTEIGDKSSVVIPVTHDLTKVEAKEANCTTAGNIEYWECSDCGEYFSNAAGTMEIGDKSLVVIPKTSHDLTKVEAKEANCTTAGNIEYWECSDCDKYFSDAAGTMEIADKSSVVIPKTSHDLTKVEAKEANCTTAGNIEYWECSDCGEYFSDAAGTAEIADKSSVVIPKTSHALTKVEAKEANCTTAGNIEYWKCSECDKYFSDAAGTTEIGDKSSVVIPVTHDLTKVEAKEANCTTAGNIEYWECSDCDKYFSDAAGTMEIADKSSVVIPKTSHALTKVEAKEANCTTAGNIEYWKCSECDKYFSNAAGTTEITDKSSVVIPKTSHDLTKVEAKEANCTTAGNIEYWECSDCDKYFSNAAGTTEITDKSSVIIPKTSHDLTKVEANEATKTEAGNIVYWVCSDCDKYFSDAAGTMEIADKSSVILPATGENGGLPDGAIAVIVIGSVVVAGVCGFCIFWFVFKKKKFAD